MVNNTTSDHTQSVVYLGILGCLGSLGILLNGLLLLALWRNNTSEFRNGTSFIIGNLALADLLTGLAVILYIIGNMGNDFIVGFQLSMVWTTILASLLSLMVLSIERIIAFAHPFKSHSIVTIRRTLVILILIWVISVILGVSVRFYKVPSQFILTVIYEGSVLVFTASHSVIFFKMQQRNKQMNLLHCNISRDTQKAMRQRSNNHVTKVVLILIIILVVTVLPYMIALQLIFWDTLQFQPAIDKGVMRGVVKFAYYFYPIELLNFIVNPVVYAFRLQRYRRAFYKALAPFNCCCYEISQVRIRTHNGSAIYSRNSYVHYGKPGDTTLLAVRHGNGVNQPRRPSVVYESDEM